jgi:hydrogenase nickel incorporation protein HypA/HybF
MHELAIAESIVDIVQAKVAECNAARVKSVRLRIGEASGIVTDSLTFCFEMLVSLDPVLTGTQLSIDVVPHRARCRDCRQEFPVTNFVRQCPTCGVWSDEVISGTELQVVEMEIENS